MSGIESHPTLVTVIIRTKDRPSLLPRALRSVQEQTYRPIEVVVVNDGYMPVDAACEPFRESFQRFAVEVPPAPGGRAVAANAGLDAAQGECLIFLDDDDWFYPTHVDRLVSALRTHPHTALAYAGVECQRFDSETGQLVTVHVFDQPFEHAFFLLRNFVPMHAAMFRRSVLDADTRFDPALEFYEDWDFWLKLLRKTPFVHMPGVSACYLLANSGFGLEQSERQRAAERLFFSKWRNRWTPRELELIVTYARQIPGLRQDAHDRLSKVLAQIADLEKTLEARQAALMRSQQILSDVHRDQAELSSENLRLNDRTKDLEGQLTGLLSSTSWRVTEPLRRWVVLARNIKSRMHGLAQRGANARTIVRQRGISGLVAHAAQKMQRSADQSPPAQGGIVPRVIRSFPQETFQDVASQIRFETPSAPRVSVVIPVYNHVGLTLACLQALQEHCGEVSMEVIVVDDASTDATEAILSNCYGLQYLRNETNSGFILSCNRGAEATRGEFIVFLNNDTEVQSGWLEPLVSVLESDPKAGIAGAKLVYPSGHLQEAGTNLRADGSVDMIGLNGDPRDATFNQMRAVDHCSGAAILIRAELFRRIGGFDRSYAPAYFEDCDLSLKVHQAGYKVIYQPASEVVHHLSVSTNEMPGGKLAQIARNRDLYLARWGATLREMNKVRLIAFYLPQFHPIPENDAWWGKGFTEWTNVTRALPQFDGHVQPQRPTELGYYDLRLPEVRAQQAQLAREHGIYGFCYYYYWFDGHRLLERPLNDVLASGEPDFPFCICWANENWTRRWDGRETDVLMAQAYNSESNARFMEELLPVLRDKRYIRISGRPLVLIYRAELIPDLEQAVADWRRISQEAGVGEVYLAAVESFSGVRNDLATFFDALVEFPPHGRSVEVSEPPRGLHADFSGKLYDYDASSRSFMGRVVAEPKLFRTAMPSWDNTPRRQQTAHIYVGATPHRYENWLGALVRQTRQQRSADERIVFINAWNEWAEGNHLEPDTQFGRAWLEATRNALSKQGCFGQHDPQ